MPYILNKTNGTILATVEDASLDLTTNLTFVGRNYSGYGEIFNENFLKLLENFSNSTAPSRPIQGQLWFDNAADSKKLKFCHDGKNFKALATMQVQTDAPTNPAEGDLWWDTNDNQLKAYDGSTYVIVGPQVSSAARSSWAFDEEVDANDTTQIQNPIIKAKFGSEVVATIARLSSSVSASGTKLIPQPSSNLYSGFVNGVRKGITLPGADAVTGSTLGSGYYFWGTAAESLAAVTATNIVSSTTSSNSIHYVPFLSTSTGRQKVLTSPGFHINPSTNVLTVTATASRYADLAEKYLADAVYEVGTVVAVGGTAEVTACTEGDRAIGVVSANPAYIMNEGLTNGTSIALKGRVPVKVLGSIEKGDRLIAGTEGRARKAPPSEPYVFAIALTSNREDGTVEAVVL